MYDIQNNKTNSAVRNYISFLEVKILPSTTCTIYKLCDCLQSINALTQVTSGIDGFM